MPPIYAVGDIHGQYDMLETALQRIEADGGPDSKIVFLGDLVDRGPGSAKVIQRLMEGQAAGRDWTILCGNHDDLFHGFVSKGIDLDPRVLSGVPWTGPRIGGRATLESYGMSDLDRPTDELIAEAQQTVPQAHLDFLANLPTHLLLGDLLFVHAGIRPGISLQNQNPDDLMWIRGEFLNDPRPHPWLVVHGHTAVQAHEHQGNRVNLDGGAGYGRPLTTAIFEGQKVWTLDVFGRAELLPSA